MMIYMAAIPVMVPASSAINDSCLLGKLLVSHSIFFFIQYRLMIFGIIGPLLVLR